jgi:hypothetical protein
LQCNGEHRDERDEDRGSMCSDSHLAAQEVIKQGKEWKQPAAKKVNKENRRSRTFNPGACFRNDSEILFH